MSGEIGWLNALPADQAEAELLTCCASTRWAHEVAARRPYQDDASLLATAVATVRELDWSDIEEALSAHPRIGERAESTASRREADWSRAEQSGAATADTALLDELAERNLAYEKRFGHVFLIRATGRSAAEMLGELHRRLHNPVDDERAEVQRQLAEITGLRVEKLVRQR